MLNLDQPNHYLSHVCKYLQIYWKSIVHELKLHQLHRAITSTCNCGDSLFSTICHLIATKFDVQTLRLYIVETFCNAIISKHKDALDCWKIYLTDNVVQDQPMVGNWQAYVINMAMSYEKGKVEGEPFNLQWTSIIFKVNIQVWSLLKPSQNSIHLIQILIKHIT